MELAELLVDVEHSIRILLAVLEIAPLIEPLVRAFCEYHVGGSTVFSLELSV